MDPCRQGSGQADTAELPQVPGERGPVVVERDCQQSRELVAAPRAAEADRHVSLVSLQQRLVKTGGRLVRHARYFWLLLPEGHLTRWLFGAILRRLEVLPGPAG